jgi:glycosyltransferase involved in cell wall biosynthesis
VTVRAIHVCILTTAHPVDDVRVNNKFAHAFRQAGFRVSWVGPGHSFFGGTDGDRDGVEFVLSQPNRSRVDRLLAPHRVARIAPRVTAVDVYYSPEPDSARLALKLACRNGARVVFDIHELFHGALLDRWTLGWQMGWLRERVRRSIADICSQCSLVVGVNSKVLAAYTSGDPAPMVVRSCAPSWFASGPPADVCAAGRTAFTVMHGKCGRERGTEQVLEALARVDREASNVRLVLFGGQDERDAAAQWVREFARSRALEQRIDLRAGVPMRQVPEILRGCDVGLIAYGRGLGVDSLPNRLFEYMAAGLPVVAPSYSVEIARVIEAEGCGLLADFEDPLSIADAILRLRRDPPLCREMGARGRSAFLARHNWEAEVRPVLERISNWFPPESRT